MDILPSFSRLQFIATLENELAVAAYRNGRYRLAAWHTIKSLCAYPYRSMDSLKRLGSGILHDVRIVKRK
jgi:hypothetical protein